MPPASVGACFGRPGGGQRKTQMAPKANPEETRNQDPYSIPNDNDLMVLVEPDAKALVRRIMVDKRVIGETDADWFVNGCRIAAWTFKGDYDPERVSKHTGERCTFAKFARFVMRCYVLKETRRICERAELAPSFSLDDDPEALPKIDADALREIMNATSTSDHDRIVSRLDLEWIIDSLPARLREAARLIYLDGVPRDEVHERLGISRSKFDHGMSKDIARLVEAGLAELIG